MKKSPFILLIFICLFVLYGCNEDDSVKNRLPEVPDDNTIKVEEEVEESIEYSNQSLSMNNNIRYNKAEAFPNKKIKSTYGHDSLSSNFEMKLYRLMESKIFKISTNSDGSGNYFIEPIELNGVVADAHMIKKVLKAFQYDNPEVFWISNSISFMKRKDSTVIKFKSVVAPDVCERLINNLNSEVSGIISNMPGGLSEYQKELYIHDVIIKRCKYSKNSHLNQAWRKFSAVGVILDGEAVCEGFSKATQILLSNVGIESRLITGSKQNEPHMWNLVKIKNNWYHLDITWDSVNGISRYNYFNLDDNGIKFDHSVDEECSSSSKGDRYNFTLPRCTSLSENYIYKNALRLDSMDKKADNDIIEEIKKIVSKKSKYMYIIIGSKLNYASTVKQLFTQKPYKFFQCLSAVESSGKVKNRVNKQKIYYIENKPINAVSIEINYV